MKTANTECVCRRFERLEGPAIRAYIEMYLELIDTDVEAGKVYYRCRICGTPWTRVKSDRHHRTSLIRQNTDFNV